MPPAITALSAPSKVRTAFDAVNAPPLATFIELNSLLVYEIVSEPVYVNVPPLATFIAELVVDIEAVLSVPPFTFTTEPLVADIEVAVSVPLLTFNVEFASVASPSFDVVLLNCS